jgi:hypothetical protein
MTKVLLQRKCRSLSDRGVQVDSLLNNGTTQVEVNICFLECCPSVCKFGACGIKPVC